MTSLFGNAYEHWIRSLQVTLGPTATVFIIIAIALIGGFFSTRLCKAIHIPYVSGYIVLGILIGPSLLAFIPWDLVNGLSPSTYDQLGYAGFSFLSDLTMGFIAFGCGRFFKWSHLKQAGRKVVFSSTLIALSVGIISGVFSFLIYGVAFEQAGTYGLAPAFLFGACAAGISPTATSSIIRQYKAKGPFVERVFINILVANIVAILGFSIVLGLTTSGALGGVTPKAGVNPFYEGIKPIITNAILIGVGVLFALLLSKLNNYRRTNDSRIILTIAFVAIIVALSSIHWQRFTSELPLAKISPLLPCMAFGIFYFNFSKSESLFIQLDNFLPPILCLFFVISGAKLQLSSFANPVILVTAIIYVASRTIAQFGTTRVFGKVFGCPRENKIYLPYTMLTMTSVAVGLISLASDIIGKNDMIVYVYTVVLTACVFLEIVGPLLAKNSLIATGSADPTILLTLRDSKALATSSNEIELEAENEKSKDQ